MGARYYGDGPFHTPHAMTGDEITAAVASFETAAENAMAAGFDGVEIHGANGYLPVQFLTPESNTRTDEHGGSLENRLRFHLQIMAAVVRGVAGRGLAGMRMSQSRSNDFNYKWAGGVDGAKATFGALAGAGADHIHVATHQGLGEEFDSGHTLAGLAREFSGLPVIACGAIGDPSWPNKLARGEVPHPFDPEMISPFATLDATDA